MVVFYSCETNTNIVEPEYTDGSLLTNALPVPDEIKNNLEGIYKITNGANNFGNEVAFKWHGEKLAVYGSKSVNYFLLISGVKDSTFCFEGNWRHMQSVKVDLLRLQIDVTNGSLNLLSDIKLISKSVGLKGSYGTGDSPNTNKLELEYLRPFSEDALNSNFLIIARRGGVRNADYIGVSENSIEMIAKAEELGGNAIEIDVKLSK